MPGRRSALAAAVGLLAAVAVLPAAPAAAHEGQPTGPSARPAAATPVPTRVIVKLRPGLGAAARASVLAGLGLTEDRILPLTGAVLATIPTGADAAAVAGALGKDSRVAYAVPDAWRSTLAGPAPDPLLGQQWGMDNVGQPIDGLVGGLRGIDVHAQDAWQIAGKGSPRVVVAVLDDGVDIAHPDLKGAIFTNTKEIPGNGIDDDHNGCVDDVHG
jgi:subtilisin family serine protease